MLAGAQKGPAAACSSGQKSRGGWGYLQSQMQKMHKMHTCPVRTHALSQTLASHTLMAVHSSGQHQKTEQTPLHLQGQMSVRNSGH